MFTIYLNTIPFFQDITIVNFAGILSRQLIDYGTYLARNEGRTTIRIDEEHSPSIITIDDRNLSFTTSSATSSPTSSDSSFTTSSATSSGTPSMTVARYPSTSNETINNNIIDVDMAIDNGEPIDIGQIVKKYHDGLDNKHWVAKYPKTTSPRSGKRYTKARRCSVCGKHTCCFCYQCNVPLCFSVLDGERQHGRNCFLEHVRSFTRKSICLQEDVSELVE